MHMIINDRFLVNATRGEVTDKLTGKTVRLEPRLMKLLCLLAEHPGQLVKRELIIREIWNDYPGADDGLNQAISGLRKLLEDDQKKIIETIPKSGYCFHGRMGEAPAVRPARRSKNIYLLAGLCIVIAGVFLARYYQATQAAISGQAAREEAKELYKLDSAQQADRLKAAGGK